MVLLRKDDNHVADTVRSPESENRQAAGSSQPKVPADRGDSDGANQQQLAERDRVISELRSQIQRQSAELASLRAREQDLQDHAHVTEAEKNRSVSERDALAQKGRHCGNIALKVAERFGGGRTSSEGGHAPLLNYRRKAGGSFNVIGRPGQDYRGIAVLA